MAIKINVPPMVDNKTDAGSDWFFCHACLAYHPPEYLSRDARYCEFALRIIQDKEVAVDEPVSDPLPASISQACDIDEKPVTLTDWCDSTCDNNSTPVNVTRQKRSLRKELPEDEIIKSAENGAVLAERYSVSKMTISRIRRGQRVLV